MGDRYTIVASINDLPDMDGIWNDFKTTNESPEVEMEDVEKTKCIKCF